jgi:hypothetical protein
MKRIPFTREAGPGGRTNRSERVGKPGCRQFWAERTAAACLFAGIFLIGCETQPSQKIVGRSCEYRDIPGTCRIESISPSAPSSYGEGFRTLFVFFPDAKTEQRVSEARMTIGDGKDPTREYLAENRIEPGREFRCIRRLRTRGPCSPEVFVFPDLKKLRGQ